MKPGVFKRSVELIKAEPIFVGFFALFFVGLKFFALTMPKVDPNLVTSLDTLVQTFLPYIVPYIGTIAAEVYMTLFVLMLGYSYMKTKELNVGEVFPKSILRFGALFLAHFMLMLALGALVVGLLYGFNAGLNPLNILLSLSSGFLAVFAALAVMLYIPIAIIYDESVLGAFRRLSNLIKEDFRPALSVLTLTFVVEFVFQILSVLFSQIPVVGGTLIDVVFFSVSNTLTTFIVMFYVIDVSEKNTISIVIEEPEDHEALR